MDAERIARNDATFREAIEVIVTATRQLGEGERGEAASTAAELDPRSG